MPVTSPRLTSAASILLVNNVVESAEWYRDVLGFRFDRYWGEPPSFCMVWRGPFCVMLAEVPVGEQIRPVSSVNTSVWDAYFWTDDAEALYDQFAQRGAEFNYGPVLKPYNVKEFVVLDPNGYHLAFGEDLDE